jgi:hypothetical protein
VLKVGIREYVDCVRREWLKSGRSFSQYYSTSCRRVHDVAISFRSTTAGIHHDAELYTLRIEGDPYNHNDPDYVTGTFGQEIKRFLFFENLAPSEGLYRDIDVSFFLEGRGIKRKNERGSIQNHLGWINEPEGAV